MELIMILMQRKRSVHGPNLRVKRKMMMISEIGKVKKNSNNKKK